MAPQRQEKVIWGSLAGQVPWSAYTYHSSKIKFLVRAFQLSLAAQNGLLVTWQPPWSLRTSIKAVFPSPLCIFFPFCNHVCLFFQRQEKKLPFTAHTWTTELTLSSWWRKITRQNQRVYPKSCLWKEHFDSVWLFFFPSCRNSILVSEDSSFCFDSFPFVYLSQ